MGILEGKVAIVTGSGRGIGKATAGRLAKEGASVVVSDIDLQPAQETVEEIRTLGGKAIAVRTDVTCKSDVQKLMEAAVKDFQNLDILVNNAGMTRDAMSHKMPEQDWNFAISVNLKGTFNCIQAAAPYMRDAAKKEKDAGQPIPHRKIVNLTSLAAQMGNAGQANYAAAKGGIISLTRVMAREWAPFKINVNCVSPGFVVTRLTDEKKGDMDFGIPKPQRDLIIMSIPIGRAGVPEDLAAAIFFLVSPDSDFITGHIL